MDVPHLAFSHVGLYVHDLVVMEDFYARVLGFAVTDRGELATPTGRVVLVFLSRSPEEHHQIVLASGRPATLAFNVINQLSFRVSQIAALRHFDHALRAEKASDLVSITHGNAISLYFRDPEGNRIELFVDTPWYCAQPCREPVDLSASDAEILERTEALARRLPGFTSRAAWSAQFADRIAPRRG